MDYQLMIDSLPALLVGSVMTVKLLAATLSLGLCLAVPLAILRVQENPLIWMPVHWYIYFFRGTPLLLQVFLIYYGLAQWEFVRDSWAWDYLRKPYWCALITMTLHTAAYTANILRGAIQAVPIGEIEAGRACGMSTFTLYRLIILPRAFRLALPAYGNEVIGMLKGTALASTITIVELTGAAQIIVARTFSPYEIFIAAGILYLCMTFILTRLLKLLEYRLNRHMRAPRAARIEPTSELKQHAS